MVLHVKSLVPLVVDWIRERKWWTSRRYFLLFSQHLLITLMPNWSRSTVNYSNFTLAWCRSERMGEGRRMLFARQGISKRIYSDRCKRWIITVRSYPAAFVCERRNNNN